MISSIRPHYLLILVVANLAHASGGVCERTYTQPVPLDQQNALVQKCLASVKESKDRLELYFAGNLLWSQHEQDTLNTSGRLLRGEEDFAFREIDKREFAERVRLLEKSASLGFAEAQFELSKIYLDSAYGPKGIASKRHLKEFYQPTRACDWAEKAAIQSHSAARVSLWACISKEGYKPKTFLSEPISLLTLSAREGLPSAATELSLLYLDIQIATQVPEDRQLFEFISVAWWLRSIDMKAGRSLLIPEAGETNKSGDSAKLSWQIYGIARALKGLPAGVDPKVLAQAKRIADTLSMQRFNDLGIPKLEN